MAQGFFALFFIPLMSVIFIAGFFAGLMAIISAISIYRRFYPPRETPSGHPPKSGARPRKMDSLVYDPVKDDFKFGDTGEYDRGGARVLIFFSGLGTFSSIFGLWLYWQATDKLTLGSLGWFALSFIVCVGLLVWAIHLYQHPHRHHPMARAVVGKPLLSPVWAWVIGWTFVAVFWTFSIYGLITEKQFMDHAKLAPGQVSRVILKSAGFSVHLGRQYTTFLEVRYKADDGKERVVVCRKGHPLGLFLPVEGDRVQVAYNPNDRTDVDIDDFWVQASTPFFAFFLGAAFLFGMLIRFKRTTR